MYNVKRILAPTDLSELSRAGVRYALDLGRATGAEVTVYHAADISDLANYKASSVEQLVANHRKALSRFLGENFSDLLPLVEVREKVEIGAAAKKIVTEAKSAGADLIVLSTNGWTGLSHVLLGSVTEKVVRLAHCPVLSIRPSASERRHSRAAA
jgi:nucleotide-binding universal stress UspA family protein